uniref:Uncharacterized protein LOC114331775 isoform X2 n=1 Tax=Diabrotica virgifera virgifera TaxID=50390 RepID=A0A6P7FLX6_DIAVI
MIMKRTISVFSVSMALFSNRVEQAGEDLLRLCYSLQKDVENPLMLTQLKLLTEFFRGLRPKIQVIGYFDVNKRLIPVMISLITSYLIIIIQFQGRVL